MKRFKAHKWSINVFDDASGIWLCEWRDEVTYRCHSPDGDKSEWAEDRAYPQYRGWQAEKNRLEPETARNIIRYWRNERSEKNHLTRAA